MAKPLSFLPFPATCLGIANAPTRSTIHFLLHESLTLSASTNPTDKDLLMEYAIGGLVAVAYKYPSLLKLEPHMLRKQTDYLAISSNTALAICHAAGSLLKALKANNTPSCMASLPSARVTYDSFYSSKGQQAVTALEAMLEAIKESRYRNLIRAQNEAAAIAIGKDAIAIAEAGVFGTKYSLSTDAKDLTPTHIKYLLSVLAAEGIPVNSNEVLASVITKALTIETDARQGIRLTGISLKPETREIAQLISKAYIAMVDWQPSQALYRMKLVAQGKLAMLVDILSEFSGISAASSVSTPAPSNTSFKPNNSTLGAFKVTTPGPSTTVATSQPSNQDSNPMPTFATRQAKFFMQHKRMPNDAEKAAIRAELAAEVTMPTPAPAAPAPVAKPLDINALPDTPF